MATNANFSDKHKHLDFIQAAVNRMAGNLFLLKGWATTLIAALFALAAKDANLGFILFALVPILIFWLLDGYFLSQERKFRELYDHVRLLPEDRIDFSMDTRPYAAKHTWGGALFSKTLLVYYIGLIVVLFVVLLAIRFRVGLFA
ncbi:MAG TPA: hypothetical protein VIL30_12690 [Ramlibacter sp.]|jgi:hypothetical protein